MADASAPLPHHHTPAIAPSRRRNILVVDDEAHVRRLLVKAFERADYCVLTAADGDEALRIVREHRPAVVLLDAEVPKVHGFDVCRRLKQDPTTCGIRILMVTAKAQDEDRNRALAAGADGYVAKPFSPRRLLEEVETQLGQVADVADISDPARAGRRDTPT